MPTRNWNTFSKSIACLMSWAEKSGVRIGFVSDPPVPNKQNVHSATSRFALRFGVTPSSPIAPPVPCLVRLPGHELCPVVPPDYIPNFDTIVPQAIRSCGASFVRFEPLTEGAMRAFFDVDSDRASTVVGCINRQVPQGTVDMVTQRHS